MKNFAPGLIALVILAILPFAIETIDQGASRFWQGMLIQVFIYAIYALSYDLLFGYTGILSFGHAMFFGTGAYTAGILLKHARFDLATTLAVVMGIALVQALIIGFLSLRVKGVYFAMV